MTKICTKCGEEKPITTEYFNRDKLTKDGFRSECKVCKRKKDKIYNDNNKRNRKKHYLENKEQRLEYQREYRQENKEGIKEYQKQWGKENRDKANAINQRRTARKLKLPATLTGKQWKQIKKYFNNSCAYCGMTEKEHLQKFNEKLHQEHFIPLSKGGEYTNNNIIPACRNCNSRKNDKDFFEWYPTYEHYNKKRETFILEYLNYKSEYVQQLALLG